jgi:hypothetical protein
LFSVLKVFVLYNLILYYYIRHQSLKNLYISQSSPGKVSPSHRLNISVHRFTGPLCFIKTHNTYIQDKTPRLPILNFEIPKTDYPKDPNLAED